MYSKRNPLEIDVVKWSPAAKIMPVPQAWGTHGIPHALPKVAILRASVNPPVEPGSG